jgi:hypothetical protein
MGRALMLYLWCGWRGEGRVAVEYLGRWWGGSGTVHGGGEGMSEVFARSHHQRRRMPLAVVYGGRGG